MRDAREHRPLGQSELIQGPSVVGVCGSLSAVGALAEGYDVQVELKDLVLGQLPLDLYREQHFLEFPQRFLFRRKGNVARELHGDGAGAPAFFATTDEKFAPYAEEGQHVDAAVLIETRVLSIENRLDKKRRHVFDW